MLALIQLLRSWAWDSPADDADTDETGELADERTAEAAWDRAWPDTSLAVPQSEEVRRLVRRGVPSSLRSAMWRRCADECNYPGLVAPTPGHYHAMLQRAAEGGLALAVAKQIDKDLHRTFGSVPGVRVPQAEALSSLRNVLMAYAAHNPEVGYCQSMNFVAAVLLLIVDEESAFWCLSAVVERVLPGHFTQCMVMSLVDQGVLRELLWAEDPELMDHFEQLQVATSLVTTQWLLTCFVGSAMPLSALLRVWDLLFYESHISILFRVAAALLLSHRSALLNATDACDAYRTLMNLGHSTHDIDALITAAYALPWHAKLQPKPLAALRRKHAHELVHERGSAAAEAAAAAVAVVEANAHEMRRDSGSRTAMAAALVSSGGWTLVPMPQGEGGEDGSIAGEEWSIVESEQLPRAPSSRCSLSYVILQLEAPRLVEEYFIVDEPLSPREKDSGAVVSRVASRLDALIPRVS